MDTPVWPTAPNFALASERALAFLQEHVNMGLWMVTRVARTDWIVLTSNDVAYGVGAGDVFRWSDSFCSRMVRGEGPRVAPVASDVPAYVEAPIGQQIPIGAYVGVPLYGNEGELFGTLCAIDPEPQPAGITESLALVELIAELLSGILTAELRFEASERHGERAHADLTCDHLTGLVNRRGWDMTIASEESRCRRHGHPAAVVMIDLDGLKSANDQLGHTAGDELLRVAAQAIKRTIRGDDVAARLGGDEFAVLLVECHPDAAASLAKRLDEAFASDGVRASVGVASREPTHGLPAAVEEADKRMYANKQANKSRAA